MRREVDTDFTDLPLQELADAALQRARDLGAEHADLRVERVRRSDLRLRDGQLSGAGDGTDTGLSVRVVLDGTLGFCAPSDLTTAAGLRSLYVALTRATQRLVVLTAADRGW